VKTSATLAALILCTACAGASANSFKLVPTGAFGVDVINDDLVHASPGQAVEFEVVVEITQRGGTDGGEFGFAFDEGLEYLGWFGAQVGKWQKRHAPVVTQAGLMLGGNVQGPNLPNTFSLGTISFLAAGEGEKILSISSIPWGNSNQTQFFMIQGDSVVIVASN